MEDHRAFESSDDEGQEPSRSEDSLVMVRNDGRDRIQEHLNSENYRSDDEQATIRQESILAFDSDVLEDSRRSWQATTNRYVDGREHHGLEEQKARDIEDDDTEN